MTLKEHIDDIRKRLKEGWFKNEASVSQGIVLRLLGELDWPTHDTQVVIPEYPVEGRRVDFALCQPPSKPLVFIEVKPVGKIEGAEKQLFEYVFHKGVPVVILTDGQEWHFFHPSGQGDYTERRVCRLDLIEMDSEESTDLLSRYLNYKSICTGEAVKAIQDDYRDVATQRQIEASLPEAWNKLVQEEDEFLLEIIAEKTENLCGDKPSSEQVLRFLRTLRLAETHPKEVTPPPAQQEPQNAIRTKQPSRFVVTMPDGERIDNPVAADTFAEVIEKLGIERVEKVKPKLLSTSNTYRNFRKKGRYYININLTNDQKKNHLENIAEALGVQLQVETAAKN